MQRTSEDFLSLSSSLSYFGTRARKRGTRRCSRGLKVLSFLASFLPPINHHLLTFRFHSTYTTLTKTMSSDSSFATLILGGIPVSKDLAPSIVFCILVSPLDPSPSSEDLRELNQIPSSFPLQYGWLGGLWAYRMVKKETRSCEPPFSVQLNRSPR